MTRMFLLAGAAALAFASPALADKGGKGGGHGGGGKPHAQQSHGGGGGGGKQARQGGGQKAQKAQKAHGGQGGGQFAKAQRPQKAERRAFSGGNGHGGGFRGEGPKREKMAKRQDWAKQDRGRKAERRMERRAPERAYARERFEERRDRFEPQRFREGERRVASYGGDCPPGLAKKHNGCQPPGHAKERLAVGERIERSWFSNYNVPQTYRTFYQDTPDYLFRYDDSGYIYRIDAQQDLISGIIPLFGGGFAVGQPLPMGYDIYNVPWQYRDTFADTDDYYYRYGDDAIYRVNAGSGVVDSIVSLLTGDLAVGQPLPDGYDVYNVPYPYRDEYYDTDESLYRYGDGAIYQVDPQTQIIQAIVEMLV
ncbi:MAG TPA: hypothetical protein VF727_14305 [Allosphingosinicella sp.]